MGKIENNSTKVDVYDREVLTLLADGGFEKLMSQYKVISRKLDECSKLNKELKQRIAELESKETEKQKKRTGVIVAREIGGQIYVTFDDFMSVVNDLQAEIGA